MAPLFRYAALIGLFAAQLSSASWVKFCNDGNCDDCGQWVNSDNKGCLNENGRQTILFKGYKDGGAAGYADLRAYDEPDCKCESSKTCKQRFGNPGGDYMQIGDKAGCFPIPKGKSYRFADCGDYCK